MPTKFDWLKQRSSDHVFNDIRAADDAEKTPERFYLTRIFVAVNIPEIFRHAVRLAHRRGMNNVKFMPMVFEKFKGIRL